MGKIPDGWQKLSKFGTIIKGTQIVSFKAPLRETITWHLNPRHHLTLQHVIEQFPTLGLVVDLTKTARYYDPRVLEEHGIEHRKMACEGHGHLPTRHQIKTFIDTVHEFAMREPEKLIGVHCTHGLKRTGYMIAKYLMEKHGMTGREALTAFEASRGHAIERPTYVADITGEKDAPTSRHSLARQRQDSPVQRFGDEKPNKKHRHRNRDNARHGSFVPDPSPYSRSSSRLSYDDYKQQYDGSYGGGRSESRARRSNGFRNGEHYIDYDDRFEQSRSHNWQQKANWHSEPGSGQRNQQRFQQRRVFTNSSTRFRPREPTGPNDDQYWESAPRRPSGRSAQYNWRDSDRNGGRDARGGY